jgi:hypothetical protein
LSIFVGLPKLTELQFVDCPGLSCSLENFSAIAYLLQSGVKIKVSTGEFLTRYNEYSTDNGRVTLPEISHTELQESARVEHIRHQVASAPGGNTHQFTTAFNNIDSTNSPFQVYPATRSENAPG